MKLDETGKIRTDLHESILRDIKQKNVVNGSRDWTKQSYYTPPGEMANQDLIQLLICLDLLLNMGICETDPEKFDTLCSQWQQNKIVTIQQSIFGEEVQAEFLLRFIFW